MSWGVSPWVYPGWDSLAFLDLSAISFPILGKFSTIISSVFSCPFLLSSFSGTPTIQMLGHLTFYQRSLRLSSFLLILFSLFASFISTILSSTSLIMSSATVILLLVSSRVFFNFSNCIIHLCLLILYFFYVLGDCINCVKCFLHFLHSISKSLEQLYYHFSEFSFR